MSGLFGFGTAATVEIVLNDTDKRKSVVILNDDDEHETLALYTGREAVSGVVHVRIPKGKRVEHRGIRVDMVSEIEFSYDRGNPLNCQLVTKELEAPGELTESKSYPFEFTAPKNDESYYGRALKLRYRISARVRRSYGGTVKSNLDFAVQNVAPRPETNHRIKMEVGIEDCLHIEFEYARNKYSLRDVVIGKIYFLRVKIKVKHMEIVLVRRESSGSGVTAFSETENLARYEIMTGAPVRGEIIPVRLFLAPYDLSPTYRNIHNAFSVRYYINLVLIDDEDRRYFKQQEIILWRDEILGNPPLVQEDGGDDAK